MPKKNIAIIAAAGRGKRAGSLEKAFISLWGRPLLYYSLLAFEKAKSVHEVIVAVPKDKEYYAEMIARTSGFKKTRKIVAGGRERGDSVYNALESITQAGYVLVHDAARPLVSPAIIERVLSAARRFGAAVPAIPASDTIKKGAGFVEETLERNCLWIVQTPQAFEYKILRQSYDRAKKEGYKATDDSSLAERLGYNARIVKGSPENIKITTPGDLIVAKALLKNERN